MTDQAQIATRSRSRTDRTVQSVEHAIDVLDALAAAPRPLGPSDLARSTGLSKATVHHLLRTLESRRFVTQVEEAGGYRLSWALYELGTTVSRDLDLARAARPFLDRLAAATGESVLLGILHEDSVLYLDRGESMAGLSMRANAGRRSPLYATASGKVLLAHSTDPALFDRVVRAGLQRLTERTVCSEKVLRHELAGVRALGYATCWQEREVGLCSLSVPIRDYGGGVVASLAVAAPAARLTEQNLRDHLKPLLETGQRIESRLGVRQSDRA